MRKPWHVVAVVLGAVSAFGPLPAEGQVAGQMAIRGIVRPVNQAQISADLQLPVLELSVREGDSFRAGQVLVRFDCESLEAEIAAAKAAAREMQLGFESTDYLAQRGAAGKLDADIAEARVGKAEAEVNSLAARMKHCTIIAPFDGRVSELSIRAYETPASGKPIIGIVEETSFEIELIAPSAFLLWAHPGQKLKFSVDETGGTYDAEIKRIGALVDPVSQTVKLMAVMAPGDRRVVSGMSGTAAFTDLELSQ